MKVNQFGIRILIPGTILLHKNYIKDQTKFIVVLNDGVQYPYLFLRTTSQARYSVQGGCQSDDRFPNYFLPKNAGFFSKDIWLMLSDMREEDQNLVLRKCTNGEINNNLSNSKAVLKPKIDDPVLVEILCCVINSNDITGYQRKDLKRIFKELIDQNPYLKNFIENQCSNILT